jgi:hypothetical protein
MEESIPNGSHMSMETFEKALQFSKKIESGSPYNLLLLSGGEPTEHPDILQMLDRCIKNDFLVLLLTNGLWLADQLLREKILGKDVLIQVTNDPRFYPKSPPLVVNSKITYIDSLTHLIPLGRFKNKTHSELPMKTSPNCFNLRSITRQMNPAQGDVRTALGILRIRVMSGSMSGHCSPAISVDGTIVAGESRNCHAIGTVDSSMDEINNNLISMTCSNCGLVNNLNQTYKKAIGEASLYVPGE